MYRFEARDLEISNINYFRDFTNTLMILRNILLSDQLD